MKHLLLLLLAAFIGCASPQKKEEGNDKDARVEPGTETVKGFTVAIPEEWEVHHNYEGTDLMVMSPTDISDSFRENFNVIVASGVENISLSDYYAQNLDYFRSSAPNFELLGEGKDKIDGAEAQWIDYRFDYSGRTVYGRQYYVIKNNKAYVITYSGTSASGDPHKTTFTNALRTVKLQ